MRKYIIAICFGGLMSSCIQKNKEISDSDNNKIRLVEHNFESFSFKTNDSWKEYISDNLMVTFYMQGQNQLEYVPNFTIMLIKEETEQTPDDIAKSNLEQLDEVYPKFKIIGYDTLNIKKCDTRKISYVAITEKKEKIGTLLYILKKDGIVLIATFQGPNEKGMFNVFVDEFEKIANSITF